MKDYSFLERISKEYDYTDVGEYFSGKSEVDIDIGLLGFDVGQYTCPKEMYPVIFCLGIGLRFVVGYWNESAATTDKKDYYLKLPISLNSGMGASLKNKAMMYVSSFIEHSISIPIIVASYFVKLHDLLDSNDTLVYPVSRDKLRQLLDDLGATNYKTYHGLLCEYGMSITLNALKRRNLIP